MANGGGATMSYSHMRRPPVVTDVDRQWALDQEPSDWAARAGAKRKSRPMFTADGALIECEDDGYEEPAVTWAQHVDEQIEAFERHWSQTGELKPAAEWSGLWRRVSWPQADPSIRHPQIKGTPHPFVRRGEAAWDRALEACSQAERAICERIGVVQFKPTDPRAKLIGG